MKKVLTICCILFTTSIFAQQEWGNMERNKLTMKEIAPIWPGCESDNVAKRDACFDKKLVQHIIQNFKYPAADYKNKVQGEVLVDFKINEKGMVEIIRVTGGTKSLRAEAKRNILCIPKMTPGMLGGKPRAIKYFVCRHIN